MKSFSTLLLVLAIGGLLCISSLVSADTVVFQDNFNAQTTGADLSTLTPPLATGASYVGSDSTFVRDGSLGGKSAGDKYAQIEHPSGNGLLKLSSAGEASTASQVVTFSLSVFAQSGATDEMRILGAKTGGAQGFDVHLSSDGTIFLGTGTLISGSGTYTQDAWISVDVVANYATQLYTATVDGSVFNGTFNNALSTTLGYVYIPAGKWGNSFDNVSISTTVPEPSTLLLAATGLLGLLAYAWRKRR